MEEFIPKTQTLNKDRKYFVEGDHFFKFDLNKERGIKEAIIQSSLDHISIPKIFRSYKNGIYHVIEMARMPGETLENLRLVSFQKAIVIDKLLDVYNYLQSKQVVHGDINVSNVLFDEKEIYLIDWEMARISPNDSQDMKGPPWGLLDLFKRI